MCEDRIGASRQEELFRGFGLVWRESRDVAEDQGQSYLTPNPLDLGNKETDMHDFAQNDLEFHLRRQEYVELCRSGKRNEALAYARKHLASQWAETHFQEITGMMGLLAFPSWTTVAMYQVSSRAVDDEELMRENS
jgi:hypothetical protein